MEFLYNLFLFLHLLGMAGIIAGWLLQLITGHAAAPKAILHSTLLQLVSGLALVGLAETVLSDEVDITYAKIGVKLTVAVAVAVVAVLNVRRPALVLAHVAGGLAIVNVAVAVFW